MHEVGEPIALVVGRERRWRGWQGAGETVKDGTRKHYNPGAPRADMTTRLFPGARRASCSPCACRRSCSRWAPTRGSTPTSANASSRASCPIATRGIRSRRRSTHLRRHARRLAGRLRRSAVADLLAAASIAWLLWRLGGALAARAGRARASASVSCCCRTRRSHGSAASGCGRSARRSSPLRSPAPFCPARAQPRRQQTGRNRFRRRRAVRHRLHSSSTTPRHLPWRRAFALGRSGSAHPWRDRCAGRWVSRSGRSVSLSGSRRAARSPISTTRRSPTTCGTPARPMPGPGARR